MRGFEDAGGRERQDFPADGWGGETAPEEGQAEEDELQTVGGSSSTLNACACSSGLEGQTPRTGPARLRPRLSASGLAPAAR